MIVEGPTIDFLTAGNPIIIKCTRQSSDGSTADITVRPADSTKGNAITLRKCYGRDGVAYIDIAPFARTLFTSELTNTFIDGTQRDGMCNVDVMYSYSTTSKVVRVINSTLQPWDLAKRDGEPLTDIERPKFYDELPFDYSVLQLSQNINTKFGALRIHKNRLARWQTGVYLGTEKYNTIATENDNLIGMSDENIDFKIYRSCLPQNPFYVRWLNKYGGIDYWCFGNNQKVTLSVGKTTTFNPYTTDRTQEKELTIGKEAEKKVKCGAVGLTDGEFKALSHLPLSTYIQWYDIPNNRWYRVQCEKSDAVRFTSESKSDIELEFTLPPVQFAV